MVILWFLKSFVSCGMGDPKNLIYLFKITYSLPTLLIGGPLLYHLTSLNILSFFQCLGCGECRAVMQVEIFQKKKTIKAPEQKKNKGPLPKQKKRTTLKTKQKRDQFCKEKNTDHHQRSDFPV